MTDTNPTAACDLIRYENSDAVAHIELNRPQESNAIDQPTAQALEMAIDRAAADEAVRAILVTGAGKRFCAGGDLRSMLAADDHALYLEGLAETLDRALRKLAQLEKPVVAAVQGAVAGAGIALILSCDLVIADPSTKFVLAYSGVGLTPDCGTSYLLPRAIGQQRALAMALTNRAVTADEALAWGLIAEVATDGSPTKRAFDLAKSLAAGPHLALGQTRRLIRGGWESTRAEVGAEEARTIARAIATPGAQNLLEKFVAR
ncbi:enoyl-CoA hydratase [Arthrobacter alpinus]|uniref:Enoyl-CoA hydratase n=1 Tax=Arthrobacter alpinus TaxID=656366 RepID=A0A0M4QQ70_9MICC|nr:enoyl-CoA hydratase/isomerase family protein [Arthrobacter alpinus]ALE93872.1 enoyl-CoA hydratase [Arthrobacter alpinus]